MERLHKKLNRIIHIWDIKRTTAAIVVLFFIFFLILNLKKFSDKNEPENLGCVYMPRFVAQIKESDKEKEPFLFSILKKKNKNVELTWTKILRKPRFTINYSYITNSTPFIQNRKIQLQGLMLHSVASPQPSAIAFINSENVPNGKAAVHGFIQSDENIFITLPILDKSGIVTRGWHAGQPSNDLFLGIEMCEPSTIDYSTGWNTWTDKNPTETEKEVRKTYLVAVDFFAYLCHFHNLSPDAILSHCEAGIRGYNTNHGDPEHIWNRFNLTMDGFREDVKKAIEEIDFSLL